jgi:hypothetical protein
VPEAPTRRARATSSNSAPRPSLERFGPRLALSTRVERGARKASRASRGSQALDAATHRRANATGIGWCRRAAGREPHSRAKIGGSKGVPARRYRLQKSASDAETQRSANPLATVRVNGGRARGCLARGIKSRLLLMWRACPQQERWYKPVLPMLRLVAAKSRTYAARHGNRASAQPFVPKTDGVRTARSGS